MPHQLGAFVIHHLVSFCLFYVYLPICNFIVPISMPRNVNVQYPASNGLVNVLYFLKIMRKRPNQRQSLCCQCFFFIFASFLKYLLASTDFFPLGLSDERGPVIVECVQCTCTAYSCRLEFLFLRTAPSRFQWESSVSIKCVGWRSLRGTNSICFVQ